MGKVVVVTDSGADVPSTEQARWGLAVVPLTVHFGEEEYRDGVDLTAEAFYQRIRSGGALPRTAQPSPGAFVETYQGVAQPGDTILSFHLSAALSGTYQSALLAASQLPDRAIQVVDTRSASLGEGLIALLAAREAAAGADAETILAAARRRMASLRVAFTVESLDWLARNGRIGRAQAWAGGLLQVRPLLTLQDGVVTPLERIRGSRRALERMVELAQEWSEGRPVHLAVLHAANPDAATELSQRLHEVLAVSEAWQVLLGPTIGTHTGPGAVGLVLLPGEA